MGRTRKQKTNSVLTGKEKTAFTLGMMAQGPLTAIVSSYLLFFYTDVIGLDIAAVGTLMVIARICDAITDPLTGYLIDHLPKSKMGRYRGVWLVGTFICLINIVVVFMGPAYLPDSVKMLVAYVSYLLIGVSNDLATIPASAMIAVEAESNEDRSTLSLLKGIATLVGFTTPLFFPMLMDNAPSLIEGFWHSIIFVWIFSGITTIIGVLGTKERLEVSTENAKYGIKDLKPILTYLPIIAVLVVQLIVQISLNMNTGTYFYTYVIGDLSMSSIISLFSVFGMIPGLILVNPLVKKFGRRKVILVTFVGSGILYLIRYIDPTNLVIIGATTFITGIVLGMGTVMLGTLQADCTDLVEYKSHVRAEGAIMSVNQFAVKLGGAIGSAMPAYILSFVGFKEAIDGVQQVQSEAAINGIIFCQFALPAIFFIIGGVFFWFAFKIEDTRIEEIRISLQESRK